MLALAINLDPKVKPQGKIPVKSQRFDLKWDPIYTSIGKNH